MPEPNASPPGWKKSVLYGALFTLIFFVALDIVFEMIELWIPPKPVDVGLGFIPDKRLFIPDPKASDWMITNHSRTAWFVDQRFKHPKPSNVFRIMTLGGSSVFELHHDFVEMARRLSELSDKQVEVVNGGGNSYGSHRLIFVANEMAQYEPDLVFIYSGHNEFEEKVQLKLAQLNHLWIQELVDSYAPARFIRDRLVNYHSNAMKETDTITDPLGEAHVTGERLNSTDLKARMQAFEANLRAIVNLYSKKNIPVLIGTVPSNIYLHRYDNHEIQQLFENGEYVEVFEIIEKMLQNDGNRRQSSEIENAIIRRVAQTTDALLVDIRSAVVVSEPHGLPGETLFYDRCHLNADGRQILIHTLEPVIQRKLH